MIGLLSDSIHRKTLTPGVVSRRALVMFPMPELNICDDVTSQMFALILVSSSESLLTEQTRRNTDTVSQFIKQVIEYCLNAINRLNGQLK